MIEINNDCENAQNPKDNGSDETVELARYLTMLVTRLQAICNSKFAEEMIKEHIDELKPFFFEFKIFKASFKKILKENKSPDYKKICRMHRKVRNYHSSI
mmetsp:Transcript_7150/g.8131  ORF Transcript_7150/g.8131 Transcript_7150/m.8131 type:complete len:100 (-) Transcript_7150:791-1090(-)